MRLFIFTVLLSAAVQVQVAYAGSEDTQTFEADCSGYNATTKTYPVGAKCSVDLLNSGCLGKYSKVPRGYDAFTTRKSGTNWVRVSPIVHYEACAAEGENGTNKKMNFKLKTAGTYAVFVDGRGDNKPQYRETVLNPLSAKDFRSFKIKTR